MASNEEKSKTSIKEKPTKKKYERFKYDKSDMDKAILAVRAGSTTLNNAAILYSVPKSTLHSKVNEIVPENCTMGRQSILTAEEELRLEKWIIGKAELGFPMHPDEIKNAVQNVLQETPYALTSQKWKEHFELQRQRDIEKVKIAAEKLEMRRLKKGADEKAAAERVEMKRLKKEAADAAKAEKIKIKEEMAKLRAESRKIKQEQGNQRRCKNTKSDKDLITPVHPIVSTEDVTTGETGSVDETPKTPRKREIDMKKRSNEPIPKASKEE